MPDKIVVFGAGATGRGHVGLLAWQAGFEIVFVDRNAALVESLQRAGQYRVKLYGSPFPEVALSGCHRPADAGRSPNSRCHEIVVSGYGVYPHLDRARIADEICSAALVLTAVFDQNLPDVAQTIALGVFAARRAGRARPLDCIACENMMDSSSTLGRHVRTWLSADDLPWLDQHVGFPDCMISRVVPRPEPDPLVIVAEDYNEWTARAEAFRGPKPAALTALELVDNQTARLERKLFLHNGGHAVCGYVGFHRGHRYIHEAVGDPWVAEHVLGAMDELGAVVQRRWGFSVESIGAYKQDFCRRGAIAEMRDEILRVVRDPIRKLSPRERLVAPAKLAVEYGLPRKWIVRGIVAALRYQHPQDSQSLDLADRLARFGLPAVLEQVCEIGPDSPLAAEIAEAWTNQP